MGDRKKLDKEKLLVFDSLLDAGSFVETLAYVADAEVTTGYGTISGRLVFVYHQHGAVNAKHARKIQNLYDSALKMGAPVIGILDSKGVKLDDKKEKNETIDVFDAYGAIFAKQTEAKGIIPQISVIFGDCLGIAGFIPSLSDFVFMHNKGRAFFNSPNTYPDSAQSLITQSDEYAGTDFCLKSGFVHRSGSNELFGSVKDLFEYLPSNTLETAGGVCTDDLNRTDAGLNGIADKNDYDIRQIIRSVADGGGFYELKEKFCGNIATGFVRLNGYTAGVITFKDSLTAAGLEKASEFIKFCDSFNISMVTFTDVKGFDGAVTGDTSLMKSAADMYRAFASTDVPKVNVIVNRAYGVSYFISNSRHSDADMVFAWRGSKVSVISPEAASAILRMKLDDSPENAASLGYIDDIIEPAETRKRVIASLEMLSSKRNAK